MQPSSPRSMASTRVPCSRRRGKDQRGLTRMVPGSGQVSRPLTALPHLTAGASTTRSLMPGSASRSVHRALPADLSVAERVRSVICEGYHEAAVPPEPRRDLHQGGSTSAGCMSHPKGPVQCLHEPPSEGLRVWLECMNLKQDTHTGEERSLSCASTASTHGGALANVWLRFPPACAERGL